MDLNGLLAKEKSKNPIYEESVQVKKWDYYCIQLWSICL